MSPYHYPFLAVSGLWALWYLYIIVMGLYRAKLAGKLSTASKVLGFPALIIGFALDWLVNWTVAAIFFRELPATPLELVTGRLTRYMAGPDGSKKRRARLICEHLLDSFDPTGRHCV